MLIAQMNVGTTFYNSDREGVADFVNRLDGINALTNRSPGFVWRLQSDNGNATLIQPTADSHFIVNMSVWESVEALLPPSTVPTITA